MRKVLVVHGPNLNLLGSREPAVYGTDTLDAINRRLTERGKGLGLSIDTFQSNGEGALVDRIHQASRDSVEFVIINPAAYTHTSVALRDALLGTALPFIEIHLSNIHAREAFRRQSWLSDVAAGVICGFGAHGYELAVDAAAHYLAANKR
ncbi:MAG: type II 3-dehydroquinate dehydratase [Aquisalimonadaceae bacterium]